jgi:hypothetical protein
MLTHINTGTMLNLFPAKILNEPYGTRIIENGGLGTSDLKTDHTSYNILSLSRWTRTAGT